MKPDHVQSAGAANKVPSGRIIYILIGGLDQMEVSVTFPADLSGLR